MLSDYDNMISWKIFRQYFFFNSVFLNSDLWHVAFWQWCQNNLMRKEEFFKLMVLRQLNINMQRMKFYSYLLLWIKMNSKWTISLNIRATAIKLLEENLWIYLHDFGLCSGFLNMTSIAQTIKERIDKLEFIKMKMFRFAKYTIKNVKMTHIMR